MSAVEIAERIPEDYCLERDDRGALAVRRELAPLLHDVGYGLATDAVLVPSLLRGRRPLLELRTPSGVFLVRRFSHGGLLRFLTRERFHDLNRPFRELAVSARLARSGVGTPLVAAARVRAAPGWGWLMEVVTRRIEHALDLDELLARARAGEVDRPVLARLARSAGRFVRAVHDAGCRHADLTTKNLLVQRSVLAGEPPRFWILDLDRACMGESLSPEDRRANLGRLYRYVWRRERLHGKALARSDALRFLAGYEPDRRLRKALARDLAARHASRLPWHALGWQLERWFVGR